MTGLFLMIKVSELKFVIKNRCVIYLYFIVFANTFSTKCEFIIDISILAARQN